MSLRICSLAARGLWIEMLSIMGVSEKYGHLQIGGVPISDKQLSVMSGVGEQEAALLVEELESNGVFSRDESGVPFCRRMVREGEAYVKAKIDGEKGGNPILKKKENLEARSQKLEATLPLTGGVNPPLNPNYDNDPSSFESMVRRFQNAMPEFRSVRDVAIENALKAAPRETWEPAMIEFERNYANCIKAPDMPLRIFGGYLKKKQAELGLFSQEEKEANWRANMKKERNGR